MSRTRRGTVAPARGVWAVLAAVCATAAGLGAQDPSSARTRVLDDFATVRRWTTNPSSGVSLSIHSDAGPPGKGRALRIDFDFHGGGGYAVVRRALDIELPENYEFRFLLRGAAPPNNLEFKLVDPSGDNVWWNNQRELEFPRRWRDVILKKRHIEFAWGPVGGGEMRRVAAIEIAVTAGQGGKGSIWLDELTLTPLDPVRPYAGSPVIRATVADSARLPAHALDGDTATSWRIAAGSVSRRLAIDFGASREYGGLVVDWMPGEHATRYVVETSVDGASWRPAYTVERGDGGRDHLFLPESESRHLRLRLQRAAGSHYAIREIGVQPMAWSKSRNTFMEAVARAQPRGNWPKYLLGEQSYWTVVGVNGDRHEGMINEEGAIESGLSRFTVEPFLFTAGRLVTWNDATRRQSLERDNLPIPSVEWRTPDLELTVTSTAVGEPGRSSLLARYRVRNTSSSAARATLYLAIRPLQVNPPWQFLGRSGGTVRIRELATDSARVRVDGVIAVVPLTKAAGFGAATFDEGGIVPYLRAGRLPPRARVTDAFGAASGALAFPLDLAAGASRDIHIELPLHAGARNVRAGQADAAIATSARAWDSTLSGASIELPPSAAHITHTLRSNLAYILVNRDGASIQPGSRSYERSWIRDGSLTSAALLRLGLAPAVREFVNWYAPFQYADGKVPCCVDHRGGDPVPENDSHGQLIYLIAEYYRHTGDRETLARHWPRIVKAVAYMDSLRRSRMTAEYRTPEKRAYFGLMPQSISHEGYSAKPMHSFWDDFFALKGFEDAAEMAGVLGHDDARQRIARSRDEFRDAVGASLRATMASHRIDYLPGAVELGDFDATSTTVALAPGGGGSHLPDEALVRTFEKYYEFFTARRDSAVWEGYTPYELRTVGTFVRLGWKARAHELLAFFLAHRRPAAWNHWAEVVHRDAAAPKFIGDMPHTWVGSDFIRSITDMLAYETKGDSALVVGAGVPEAWVTEAPGVRVRGLSTHFGLLDMTMAGDAGQVTIELAGTLRIPPNGIVVHSPIDRPLISALLDGAPVDPGARGVIVVRRVPARLVLRYR